MTEISAALVKELRDQTGAGMMDCKRALQDTSGDLEAAQKLLRERGLAQRRQARRPRDDRGQGRLPRSPTTQARRDRRGRLRDRAGLEQRGVPRLRRRACSRPSSATARRRSRAARRGAAGARRPSSARTSSSPARRGSRPSTARVIDGYVHPPANKLGVLVQRARRLERARAHRLAMHIALAGAALDRPRGRPGGDRHRRARDLRELGRGAVEAGAGAREDRRGDAEQALLRRAGARRPALDPRHGEDSRRGARRGRAPRCSSSSASQLG